MCLDLMVYIKKRLLQLVKCWRINLLSFNDYIWQTLLVNHTTWFILVWERRQTTRWTNLWSINIFLFRSVVHFPVVWGQVIIIESIKIGLYVKVKMGRWQGFEALLRILLRYWFKTSDLKLLINCNYTVIVFL